LPNSGPIALTSQATERLLGSLTLETVVHLFDTGWVARPVLNVEQPPNIPQRPMGSIPVVARLVRPDGEE
jgi:hypothetical protein